MNEYRGYKGTKFQLVLLTLIIGTVMLWFGKITGDMWTWGVGGIIASYITGDVASRFAEAKK